MSMILHGDEEYDMYYSEQQRLCFQDKPDWLREINIQAKEVVAQLKGRLSKLKWEKEKFEWVDKVIHEANKVMGIEDLPYRTWRTDICLKMCCCDYNMIQELMKKIRQISRYSDWVNLTRYAASSCGRQESFKKAQKIKEEIANSQM